MAEIIKTDLHPINEPDKILYPTTSPDQIVGLDEYIDNKTLTGPIGPVGPQGGDGEKGDKGDKGDPGESPVITANATVDNSAIGVPACDVKKTQTAPNTFNYQFNFRNIKGAKGDEGKQGEAGKDGVEITSIHTLKHRVEEDETINTVEAVYSDGNSSEFEVHCENGADFKVTAYVQSTEQLPLANEEYAGIAYGVGAIEPYSIYICVLNTASEPYHYEWINFGTIQGPKGDKGDPGETGATGPKGDKGDTGATGPKGDKGDPGETGATGPKGDKGDPGETGATGPSNIASVSVTFVVSNLTLEITYLGNDNVVHTDTVSGSKVINVAYGSPIYINKTYGTSYVAVSPTGSGVNPIIEYVNTENGQYEITNSSISKTFASYTYPLVIHIVGIYNRSINIMAVTN